MLATMQGAGINAAGIAVVNASPYTAEILADLAFENTLRGLTETMVAPVGTQTITSVAGLSQIQAGGTYLIQGDLTLTQPIDVPSNVTIYVDGSLYYQGTHSVPAIHQGENLTSAIFVVDDSDNVNLIGINNALLHSTPNLAPTSPHASGVVITGNASNVLVEGFEMSHVWEGVASHWGTSNTTVKHNYIHDTLQRALWFLNADNSLAVHNFLQNAGMDGIDFDAFNDNTIAYENVAMGSGRWAGFVEEGATGNYFIRGVAIMADMGNPNVGYQMGWADNGTTQEVIDNGGLTENNYFIDNVSFRPGGFPDGGSYFSNENVAKGMTYFWGNRGYGFTQNEANPGNLMEIAEWLDTIPTAGGPGNAINAQQLLADLAIQYAHNPTEIDAGSSATLSLPQHSYLLQPTLTTTTPINQLIIGWQSISGPDQVQFSNATDLTPTVNFRRAGTYTLEVSVNDAGIVVSDTMVIQISEPGVGGVGTTTVTDGFETYATGTTPAAEWDVKWDGTNTTQRELFEAQAGTGEGGGQSFALDVTASERGYRAINQNGVTGLATVGDQIVLRTDVQIGLTGAALNGGVDGTNEGLFGLLLSDTPNWDDGTNETFQIARRSNGNWGIRVPSAPWIQGWHDNTDLGFANNSGSAGLSGWNTFEVVLTDNGTNYDAEFRILDANGATAHTSAGFNWSTSLASGSTIYGGVTTGWNNEPAGTTTAQLSKVSAIRVDNFELTANSNAAATIELGDFDADGDHDIDDIDELVGAIASGAYDIYYDTSEDGVLNIVDIVDWLSRAGTKNLPGGGSYLFGDANLDGHIDNSDFNRWLVNKTTSGTGWSGADFNADGMTDEGDFSIWTNNRFQSAAGVLVAATSAAAVENPMDINGDGVVSPIDALIVVNAINESADDLVMDIDGDGVVAPLDALLVVNHLNNNVPPAVLADFVFSFEEDDDA